MVPQGEHFMEMAVYEGQRCEKATGKISFLDSPHNVLPASYLWCVTLKAGIICMCLFMLMQTYSIEVHYQKQKKLVFKSRDSLSNFCANVCCQTTLFNLNQPHYLLFTL